MLHPTSHGRQGYEKARSQRVADVSEFIRELSESLPFALLQKMVNGDDHAQCAKKEQTEVETIIENGSVIDPKTRLLPSDARGAAL